MKQIIIILLLSFMLQSCVFVAGAAAGAAAIAVVYDHRTVQKVYQDQKITNAIINKFQATPELCEQAHINVAVFNQVVLLTGEALTPNLREEAARIANAVPGVTKVYNQICIQELSSTMTRANDSWITTKIKTQMLATKGLQSGTIKVVTENCVVYLMGIVTHEQANMTVNIAREVSGVRRVVKVLQYCD